MSISIGITCDRCPNALAVDLDFDGDNPVTTDQLVTAIRQAADQAFTDGWSVTTVGGYQQHFCPSCTRFYTRHRNKVAEIATAIRHANHPKRKSP